MFLKALLQRSSLSSGRRSVSSYVERVRLQEAIKENEALCKEHLEKGRFMLMHKGKPLMDKATREVAWKKVDEAPKNLDNFAFLGVSEADGKALFAVNVESDQTEVDTQRYVDLRVALFSSSGSSQNHLTRAWSLLQWHRKTSFCSNCGSKLGRSFSGSSRSCSDCGSVYYPHLSPVGIVLVAASDHSKVLLIRQPRYPPGMFSCIAGFVDVGESLEECVKREAAEEVGVNVEKVIVHSSQHWPFPAGSLMVGCLALTNPDSTPDPDHKEIEEARWFSPEQLKKAFDNASKDPRLRMKADNSPDNIFVPPKEAIAHHLIRHWLTEHGHL